LADLALNDSLIDEYIKYKFQDNFDINKVRKLLKYIQPFDMRDNHRLLADPSMPMQLNNDPLISIVPVCSDEDLVQNTSLKLMLVDNRTSPSYTALNIDDQSEKIKLRFGGIYSGSLDKNKAQKHIKALLSDGNYIKISDSYIDGNPSQWNENKAILGNLIPHNVLNITIESGSVRNRQPSLAGDKKAELITLCGQWSINARQYNDNVLHDRYIETDKVKILLSSGLYNLSSSSNKDFTYVVELQ
jgi:hypothetical protein